MALAIDRFICRADNYGILIHDGEAGLTAAIDAPDGSAILDRLSARGWTLTHILTTHKHGDHVAGNEMLKARFGCEIIGPVGEADAIPGLSRTVAGGEHFLFGGQTVAVIDTPGHTNGHIAYHLPDAAMVFAGDCLFALGCGRLFEGTPEAMWESMLRLRALPDETMVDCGHDYTASNARFAMALEPDNESLQARGAELIELAGSGAMTLPVRLGDEKLTNPFLRADDPALKRALGMEDESAARVFAEIRKRKDRF